MRTTHQRRTTYIAAQRSDVWISEQTGIPRSTVGFVRRGERYLPKQYRTELRNLYQRESYGRLREEGFSYHQARRFSSYAPESAKLNASTMRLLADDLTRGAIASRLKKLNLPVTEENITAEWNTMRKDIVEGLRRSHKSWEDIKEYIAGF